MLIYIVNLNMMCTFEDIIWVTMVTVYTHNIYKYNTTNNVFIYEYLLKPAPIFTAKTRRESSQIKLHTTKNTYLFYMHLKTFNIICPNSRALLAKEYEFMSILIYQISNTLVYLLYKPSTKSRYLKYICTWLQYMS